MTAIGDPAPDGVAARARALPRGAVRGLLVATGLTAVMYAVPQGAWLAAPLLWLSTLAHELGHGLTALLVGAEFTALELYADGSGVAAWRGSVGALGQAAIAAGGLLGPAVGAALCFAFGRSARAARIILGVAAIGLLLGLVLWVRTLFGAAFVAALAVGCGTVAWRLHDEVARVLVLFLGIQLALSVFSRGDYLFATTARTGAGLMPSDTQQMAEALWLPAWFWGALVGVLSVGVLAGGLTWALRPTRRRSAS